jgi:uncharacterized membrane protein YphA (DoxX/SURF4 family)
MTWNIRNCARTGLQWSLGIVLIYESSRLLFYSGARAAQSAHLPHVLLLAIAAVELLGAILFLVPPLMQLGGKLLIGTFLVAAVVHILHGQPDVGYLVIYGMAVLTVITNR